MPYRNVIDCKMNDLEWLHRLRLSDAFFADRLNTTLASLYSRFAADIMGLYLHSSFVLFCYVYLLRKIKFLLLLRLL